jgi:hypothetical protein
MARAAFLCLSVALAACHTSKAAEQAQRAVIYYQQYKAVGSSSVMVTPRK